MKRELWIVIAVAMTVNTAYAELPNWDDSKIYLGVEIGTSQSKIKSGGYNTAGPHENTNDDTKHRKPLGVKIGMEFSDRWRFDIGYREYENQDYITGSFQPPTPTFFYNTNIKSKSVIATAYYNMYKHDKLDIYGALGVGASRSKISTTDAVVEGSETKTSFSWQVELGVDYPLTKSLIFSAGVRYFYLGKIKIDLSSGGGFAAGNFVADLSSKEAFLGLRYIF